MTEAEWLTTTDAGKLLGHLARKKYNRKLRLFACACCREMWQYHSDEQSEKTVEVAERFADGLASEDERRMAFGLVKGIPERERVAPPIPPSRLVAAAAQATVFSVEATHTAAIYARCYAQMLTTKDGRYSRDDSIRAALVRHIFGNPFRSITVNSSWLTSTVRALAEGIYQDRAFDRMPILADALQDAGCDNDDVLNHCRQPGEHARGCWVVDLVLGKE